MPRKKKPLTRGTFRLPTRRVCVDVSKVCLNCREQRRTAETMTHFFENLTYSFVLEGERETRTDKCVQSPRIRRQLQRRLE